VRGRPARLPRTAVHRSARTASRSADPAALCHEGLPNGGPTVTLGDWKGGPRATHGTSGRSPRVAPADRGRCLHRLHRRPAAPPPFSESPAPSAAGSLVDPQPGPTAAAAGPAPTATSSVTSSPTSAPPTQPSTGTVTLRTSYPGIEKLVIIPSKWNSTPAGRAALNAVAAYNSYLATAPHDRSTTGLESLSLPGCASCAADIRNDSNIIRDRQRYRSPTGDIRSTSVALFVESRTGTEYLVRSDAAVPALQLIGPDGKVVASAAPRVYSTELVVQTAAGADVGRIASFAFVD
jgi:hypothetical protein